MLYFQSQKLKTVKLYSLIRCVSTRDFKFGSLKCMMQDMSVNLNHQSFIYKWALSKHLLDKKQQLCKVCMYIK